MPLEGHYARQTTPLYKLSSRELKAATAVLVVTVISLLAIVLFTVGDSEAAIEKGCIAPTVAGIVGAETIRACGSEAVSICQHAAQFDGERAETIVADCKKHAVAF